MVSINWIEIPATNHERAIKFYSTLLDSPIEQGETLGMPYSFLPDGIGAIASSDHVEPSASGITVYIHLGDNMSPALAKVEPVGGKIIVPKSPLGEENYFAIIHDSEGNRLGLYSYN